ncbi:MAG: hypothetical protein HOV81_39790 [Kofleriaceae bacterium]|nr:hypothetical protein [Kofleriaceae bacterium]
MKATLLIPALSVLVPTVAFAQPEESESSTAFDHHVAPADHAFEISVGTGYTQGGGKLGEGMLDLEDVAGPGGSANIELGYRIIPHLTVGAYGSFARYANGDSLTDDVNVLAATAGVQAAWHFRPDRSVDPWVSLGAGWKGLWLDPDQGKATALQGFELARLQVGVDYRISPEVSIAPVIGGGLGMYVAQDSAMTTEYSEIDGKKVNFTGFAGVAGRFDLGGRR